MMSVLAKEELVSRTKALSKEEIEIVLDNVPIELVHAAIGRKLQKDKECITGMQQILEGVKDECF